MQPPKESTKEHCMLFQNWSVLTLLFSLHKLLEDFLRVAVEILQPLFEYHILFMYSDLNLLLNQLNCIPEYTLSLLLWGYHLVDTCIQPLLNKLTTSSFWCNVMLFLIFIVNNLCPLLPCCSIYWLYYQSSQLRTEGPKGFFKGLVPIALRAWPANAVSNSVTLFIIHDN